MAPAPRTTNAAPQAAAGLPVSSPLRGILFLITSTIVFSVADVITKKLAATLPPPEVAWMRYITFAARSPAWPPPRPSSSPSC